ncbi:MAG: alpha/beta hydrolase [Moraxellaceae bacterium]|nr:MAG: alpha/beta hydrolase [Moraxellaceae bacterium]
MKKRSTLIQYALSFLFGALTIGCSTQPYEQSVAKTSHTNLQTVTGSPFIHQVYVNQAAFTDQTDNRSKRFLHVYIGGDGRAYVNGKFSINPTPLNPLLLKLMEQDIQPAIYLGRPCYFNPIDSNCHPTWWTDRRYNEQVVTSLLAALSHFSSRYDHIVLIGYSGGGALAMLMAEQLKQTQILVTIAGNLDTFEWTTYHQYTPLMESLNPADRPPLRSNIIQLHYAGKKDDNIKADWIKSVSEKQKQAEYHLIDQADHACCWVDLWPKVLKKIESYQSFID